MKKLILLLVMLLVAGVLCGASYFPFIAGCAEVRAYFALPNPTGSVKTLNDQIKLIKAGGSVTLSGLTANFSNVAGFQFVTNPSVDLRKWIGYYITFTSTTGNTLKVKVSAAGTGETLDTEVMTNGTFDQPIGWALSAGSSIVGGQLTITVTAGEMQYAYRPDVDLTTGALYQIVVDIDSATGTFGLCSAQGNNWTPLTNLSDGTILYRTALSSSTDMGIKRVTTSGNYSGVFNSISVKKVLTPSATGIYFTDPVVTGTFDYNAASFTAVVTGS